MATTLAQVKDRVTLAPVEKGEVLSLAATADKSAVYGLAAIIPPGKRAMSITVDATDVVPGLLQPGQRVDVVASFVSGSDSVAKTILQNVPLLAVNGSATASPAEQPGQMVKPSATPDASYSYTDHCSGHAFGSGEARRGSVQGQAQAGTPRYERQLDSGNSGRRH